jgi:membrane associated rhomboid family serine protease
MDFLKYPVTGAVTLLAVTATILMLSGRNIEPLVCTPLTWQHQPWQLATSALPHVNFVHLLFNLYWLWVFGSVIEANFGPLRTAAIYLFFAVGSSAAEVAIFRGGIGLSGVGYGLFGLLWILGPRDERFRNVVDAQTTQLFIVWFFLCIALTVYGVMPVANVAHGVGATGDELAYEGYRDLESGRFASGAALFERALRLDNHQALWWYDLGIAYERLDRDEEATEAFRQAAKLDPGSKVYREGLVRGLVVIAYKKQCAGQDQAAAELYRKSLDLDEGDATTWFNLGIVCQKLGRNEDATRAYERAAALAPSDEKIRAGLQAWRKAGKK